MQQFGTVTVVGVGLIGGSIGRALRTRKLVDRVVGIGRSVENLNEALRIGAIDEATTELAKGVGEADVVVVCTPVSDVAGQVRLAARHAPSSVLITDAGSTKRIIVEAIEADSNARSTFVAAHPIAGSERKGAAYSDADLFEGRVCVLTPTTQTPLDRFERANAFWASIGCSIVILDPTAHDEALALTSHLPHAVAAALARAVPVEFLKLAAGAYRDGTRVAGSDAALWSAIFLANRAPLLDAVDQFQNELANFRLALEVGDEQAIQAWWALGKNHRARYDSEGPGGAALSASL